MICSTKPRINRQTSGAGDQAPAGRSSLCRTPFRPIACSLLAPSARKRADLRRVGPAQESDKLNITDAERGRLLQIFLQFLFQRRFISTDVPSAAVPFGVPAVRRTALRRSEDRVNAELQTVSPRSTQPAPAQAGETTEAAGRARQSELGTENCQLGTGFFNRLPTTDSSPQRHAGGRLTTTATQARRARRKDRRQRTDDRKMQDSDKLRM